MKKETVVFDFDGVIHSYKSPWQGATVIPDPPVEGIREAIADVRKLYNVVVVSTRCIVPEGKKAVEDYLRHFDIEVDAVLAEKPPAIAYIDDRAICFDGEPSKLLSKISNFVPWNKHCIPTLQPCPFCGKFPTFSIMRSKGYYESSLSKLIVPVEIRCETCGISKISDSMYRLDWMGNSIKEIDGLKELSEWWNKRSKPIC